jgi:hypothetical protein
MPHWRVVDDADARDVRRLLRARGNRPRDRDAEQRDELASFELIELHSVLPVRAASQDIELAGISQRSWRALYNRSARPGSDRGHHLR